MNLQPEKFYIIGPRSMAMTLRPKPDMVVIVVPLLAQVSDVKFAACSRNKTL